MSIKDPRFTAYPGSPDPRFQANVVEGLLPSAITSVPKRLDPTLVTGLRWPFRLNSGRVAVSSGAAHLLDNVKRIIAVGKGEYVMLPQFGSSLHRRLFDPINVASLGAGDIQEAVSKWEPRVLLNSVKASLAEAPHGSVSVVVSVTPLGKNDAQSIEMNLGR